MHYTSYTDGSYTYRKTVQNRQLEVIDIEIKPTLGMIVRRRNRRKLILHIYNRYNHSDINLIAFNLEDMNWKKRQIHALYMKKDILKEGVFPFPQVIYNRCYLSEGKLSDYIGNEMGATKIYNRITRMNKWRIYKMLEPSPLKKYLPHTCPYKQDALQTQLETDSKKKVLFLKPCIGHQGKGIYRLEVANDELKVSQDSSSPMYIWSLKDNFWADKISHLLNDKPYIMQSGIELKQINDRHFDLRVLVQKNISGNWEVTNIVSRETHKHYYNTSIFERVHITEDLLKVIFNKKEVEILLETLRTVSIKTAMILDEQIGLLAELSIDFGLDIHGELWIIEVNGKPQKSIYTHILDVQELSEVYRKPIEYALYLTKKTSSS